MNILVADDENSVRFTLKKLIEGLYSSVNVYEAWDGFTAGAKLAAEKIELVFLDMRMPGVNGYDVIDFINENPLMGNPHIIIVTGYCDQKMKNKLQDKGVKDIIQKPFDIKEIRRILKKYIIG